MDEVHPAIHNAMQATVDRLTARIDAVERKQTEQFRWLMTLLVVLICLMVWVATVVLLAATVWRH